MLAIVSALLGALVAAVRPRASLVVEILVLRQQLAVFRRDRPRPPLRPVGRAFWVVGLPRGSRWTDALAIVKPATVIAWHRRGFARFWTWQSRHIGRPPLAPEIVALIVRIAGENPLWSRRRIANELAKLGHDVGKDAVAKYMPKPPWRPRRPLSQTSKTFLTQPSRGHGRDRLCARQAWPEKRLERTETLERSPRVKVPTAKQEVSRRKRVLRGRR